MSRGYRVCTDHCTTVPLPIHLFANGNRKCLSCLQKRRMRKLRKRDPNSPELAALMMSNTIVGTTAATAGLDHLVPLKKRRTTTNTRTRPTSGFARRRAPTRRSEDDFLTEDDEEEDDTLILDEGTGLSLCEPSVPPRVMPSRRSARAARQRIALLKTPAPAAAPPAPLTSAPAPLPLPSRTPPLVMRETVVVSATPAPAPLPLPLPATSTPASSLLLPVAVPSRCSPSRGYLSADTVSGDEGSGVCSDESLVGGAVSPVSPPVDLGATGPTRVAVNRRSSSSSVVVNKPTLTRLRVPSTTQQPQSHQLAFTPSVLLDWSIGTVPTPRGPMSPLAVSAFPLPLSPTPTPYALQRHFSASCAVAARTPISAVAAGAKPTPTDSMIGMAPRMSIDDPDFNLDPSLWAAPLPTGSESQHLTELYTMFDGKVM